MPSIVLCGQYQAPNAGPEKKLDADTVEASSGSNPKKGVSLARDTEEKLTATQDDQKPTPYCENGAGGESAAFRSAGVLNELD